MIHSSRQARPTTTLRRTASATPSTPSFNLDATEFSKQFNLQHLLNSPLPSPALPSILPRHGKKPAPRHYRKAARISVRLSTWLCGITFLYWLIQLFRNAIDSPTSVTYLSVNVNELNIPGQDSTTQDVMPAVVADLHKKPKWTVSIPQEAGFPLKPSQYADICLQCDSIIEQLHSTRHNQFHSGQSLSGRVVKSFIDVQEAHDQGLLPTVTAGRTWGSHDRLDGKHAAEVPGDIETPTQGHGSQPGICKKSLVFTMESADAGMGKTLMGLWMAFGLAQEESRAFFIDDTNWAYGKYSTFFKPPPVPPCRLPPATQRLPCPHQTRHLVVSTSTYRWIFGDLLEPLAHGHHSHNQATRRYRAFSFARAGHDALFHLARPDADYLSARLAQLDSIHSDGRLTIGLHIRRGDRHPWEPQYSDSYIPASTYSNAAQALLANQFNPTNTTLPPEVESRLSASKILLASDDPEVYSAPEFTSSSAVEHAQSQILLASKANLDAALHSDPVTPPPQDSRDPAFTKFVEPNVGWEGGFFASIFWGLGNAVEGRRAARGLREERPKEGP
ncbi:MAG: hypothetical protein Q9179_007937, partial [Wetmoreana sp. 5 TL-2023]